MAGSRVVAALAAVVVLLGACSSDPSEPSPPTAVARGQDFELVMRMPSDHFALGQAIDVGTTLTWAGPADKVTVWGSGSGTVLFQYEELTGKHRMLGGGATADCRPYEYARGAATPIRLGKGGGWDAQDPEAAFYDQFYRDPLLHLPAGRWRITAELTGMLAPCDANAPGVSLKAVLEIGVG